MKNVAFGAFLGLACATPAHVDVFTVRMNYKFGGPIIARF
jgi:hypothetical protein